MDKSHFINLTLTVYRVTDLFPEKEPLRFLVRRKVNQILADLVLLEHYFREQSLVNHQSDNNKLVLIKPLERVLKNVAVLGVYFDIAEKQNWVKPENFLVLKAEYGAIMEEMKRLRQEVAASQAKVDINNPAIVRQQGQDFSPKIAERKSEYKKSRNEMSAAVLAELNTRQQKILQILKEQGRAQVQDLNKILPQVTKRTLRRDMDFLLKRGLVVRMGDKIKTEYKLRG